MASNQVSGPNPLRIPQDCGPPNDNQGSLALALALALAFALALVLAFASAFDLALALALDFASALAFIRTFAKLLLFYQLLVAGIYTTWTVIAGLINLTAALVYPGGLDQTNCCIASLSLLVIFHVTWFILENFVFDKYARFVIDIGYITTFIRRIYLLQ